MVVAALFLAFLNSSVSFRQIEDEAMGTQHRIDRDIAEYFPNGNVKDPGSAFSALDSELWDAGRRTTVDIEQWRRSPAADNMSVSEGEKLLLWELMLSHDHSLDDCFIQMQIAGDDAARASWQSLARSDATSIRIIEDRLAKLGPETGD